MVLEGNAAEKYLQNHKGEPRSNTDRQQGGGGIEE
jgi:hypothetical protein